VALRPRLGGTQPDAFGVSGPSRPVSGVWGLASVFSRTVAKPRYVLERQKPSAGGRVHSMRRLAEAFGPTTSQVKP
jgi:hypothetical protein